MGHDHNSSPQALSALVEWYLQDKQVELKFVPNPSRKGRIAPEYDFVYWQDDRRITERTLAMSIMIDLGKKNYTYNLGKVISALTELAWRNYVENAEYPQWMRDELPPMKKPLGRPARKPPKMPKANGRPRTKPAKIVFDPQPLNTQEPEVSYEQSDI